MRAYDDAQRAITYLRWRQGDADRIAPSLYGGRGQRKGDWQPASPTDGAAEPADTGHAAPVPGGNGAPAAPVVPGGPGGNPFVDG